MSSRRIAKPLVEFCNQPKNCEALVADESSATTNQFYTRWMSILSDQGRRSVKRGSAWGVCGAVTYVLCFSGGCFGSLFPRDTSSPPGTTTTIIIVRHAERDPGLDPPLNAAGIERAEALKDVLAEHGVTAIYTTDLIRNRDSVQPLADELGLSVNLVSPLLYADTEGTAATLVDEFLNEHAGGTILFCGNIGQPEINVIGINERIYTRLGGTGRSPERYEDLYIAVVPDEGPTRFVKAVYGACGAE